MTLENKLKIIKDVAGATEGARAISQFAVLNLRLFEGVKYDRLKAIRRSKTDLRTITNNWIRIHSVISSPTTDCLFTWDEFKLNLSTFRPEIFKLLTSIHTEDEN